jgi:hypothetical protein
VRSVHAAIPRPGAGLPVGAAVAVAAAEAAVAEGVKRPPTNPEKPAASAMVRLVYVLDDPATKARPQVPMKKKTR